MWPQQAGLKHWPEAGTARIDSQISASTPSRVLLESHKNWRLHAFNWHTHAIGAVDLHQQHRWHAPTRGLCCRFAPMSHSAPPLAPTLMFAAPGGAQHDLCGDSSMDETAAGGLHDAFIEVSDELALAVDASEDDECDEEPVGAGVGLYM